ncbi:MAG: MmcQ/YjbR family DNA-binding protein [Ruminococcus sp.]|nr:MmcQ/YjbR family DNA-binding protein [Ruminococcus sp.]
MRERIFSYSKEEYGVTPEYLWARFPSYAVLRRADSRKWFGLIMDIPFEKIDKDKNGKVDIINVKLDDTMLLDLLLTQEGFYKGYHISRGNWISVTLDGRVDIKKIFELLDISYAAAGKNKKR